jgi:hypothetical protein
MPYVIQRNSGQVSAKRRLNWATPRKIAEAISWRGKAEKGFQNHGKRI